MHDDLTYRQQRNLNLISESLLTGRSEPAFQAGREAAMLNEQFGMGGRRGPKLTMTMPDDSVADMNPLDAVDIVGSGSQRRPVKKKDLLGGIKDLFNKIAAIPGDVVDFVDDNVTAEILKALGIKTREGTGGGLVTPSEADILAAILIAAGLIPGPPSLPSMSPKDDDDDGQNPV